MKRLFYFAMLTTITLNITYAKSVLTLEQNEIIDRKQVAHLPAAAQREWRALTACYRHQLSKHCNLCNRSLREKYRGGNREEYTHLLATSASRIINTIDQMVEFHRKHGTPEAAIAQLKTQLKRNIYEWLT
ncbi:MAG: hypothetical protein JW725_02025 [Candidatus Babeliaceae bacterium]|nr:hypothetical protein [Candidatus Babeliaceae bacterium]